MLKRTHIFGLILTVTAFVAPAFADDIIPVTNTADSGGGSLRQAIISANDNADLDTITFNIPASDPNCADVTGHGIVCTIGLDLQIDVVFPVIIDGYTQPLASANTNPITSAGNAKLLIEIKSIHPPGSQNAGLVFGSNSSGSTVRGLVMNRLSFALLFQSSSNNIIEGNYIGMVSANVNTIVGALR